MQATTLALVGATGGAGTTRTAVELAAIGARDGRDVAVVDAAFTTQGLSEYVSGRIGTDLTTLVTDETGASLAAATYPIELGDGHTGSGGTGDGDAPSLPGRADAIPSRAPFERVARAKTAEAARKLERRIDEAATSHDAVIVDAAPVGSNEAVAGVTAADRTAAVFPATAHGRDALQRLRGRIADVGAGLDRSIAVARGVDGEDAAEAEGETDADVRLPSTDPAIASAPTTATGSGAYARAVAAAFEDAFDATVGIEFEEPGVIDRLRP
ncbi:cell division inhibitor [Halorubrum lipolyticum]|uniref:Cell division inhibitor n=1 Tax=Halorubrum lipolyticum DSM 21995 TaxID=1227482 RepID=M0NUB4_9EURY|nr:cell division inhibitor [Halorubrum lipolyticum]EMA60839.1 cell division inhibitor [Halorubrum lipolyticum DSM 21995]